MWDVASSLSVELEHDSSVDQLAISPDGSTLATSGAGAVTLWPFDLPTDPAAVRNWVVEVSERLGD
jgi:hypothetical protein